MLTIKKNTDQYAFILSTFGFIDHLLYTTSFSFLQASSFINKEAYNALKLKCDIESEPETLSFEIEQAKILIVIVDGISKLFLSVNPNVDQLKVLLSEADSIPLSEIDTFIEFYLKMSTKLFDNYRSFYKDDLLMIEMLDKLTLWKTKI